MSRVLILVAECNLISVDSLQWWFLHKGQNHLNQKPKNLVDERGLDFACNGFDFNCKLSTINCKL